MSLDRGRRRDRPGPARPPGGSCSPSTSSATSAPSGAGYALTPRVLELGVAYVRSIGPVGRRPPAPGALVAQHRRVVLDRPARRLRHRLRRPGRRAQDRRAGACRSAPASRRCRRRWARCCSPRCARTSSTGCSPSRAGPGSPPRWQPDRAERDAALREVRGRGWALTDEQLALGHPVGRRAAARRAGEVIAALNVNMHAAETSVEHLLERPPAAAAADRGRDQRRLRPRETVPHVTRRRRLDRPRPCQT